MRTPSQEELAKRFGKNLSGLLTELDMSQITLSRLTGLTPAAISQIMSGQREPLLSTVIKILEVIPCSFERMVRK